MWILNAGWPGIRIVYLLRVFGTSLCMLGVQYLLLKSHRARRVLSAEVVPTQSELFAAVACFWLAYLGALKTLLHGVRGPIWILTGLESHHFSSHSEEVPSQKFSEAELGFQLLNIVLLTWQLHQFTLFTLDSAIPFTKSFQRSPRTALLRLCSRFQAFVAFFQVITNRHSAAPPVDRLRLCISDEDSSLSTNQKIRLQRTQASSPKRGRTLSWSLTVDKEALDEMKETLGPPGGFGELGFCVGKDEVRFEAMGKGTSFGLVFGIEEQGNGVLIKPAVRPEVKGKRRKTK